ncbi:MAG: hypothetical protein OEM83_02115 [Gammaproteobacteria bacterium]|nr:hypothetical protein [Gammaproteobacteria bacterium]MDH5512341.1 hypothetical protein [Gammaproteobacteria bacterium]
MSAAAFFASQFFPGEFQTRTSRNTQGLVRQLGGWGFAFFALRGIAWLLPPLMAMYLA